MAPKACGSHAPRAPAHQAAGPGTAAMFSYMSNAVAALYSKPLVTTQEIEVVLTSLSLDVCQVPSTHANAFGASVSMHHTMDSASPETGDMDVECSPLEG